ncbi:MAG: hypothetical protein ACLFRG_20220 [Desulfococcaceae bacterium]
MKPENGTDYGHNYDVIVKWLADALRGQTLEAIGVPTGRIEEVFAFEVADISVTAGRVDIMVRDHFGDLYHIEEERNLRKSDLYRFAAYHFMGAKQWGTGITDIVLASGDVYPGEKSIRTSSGKYTPIVIDFSILDARKRLAEICREVESGTFSNWLELVFLPLYGKESGAGRGEIVEEVIRYESRLFQAEKISARLLAATLVMSNKLIDKDRIHELWEEIKMLDVLEVAREKGLEEGKVLGVQEGKALGVQEGKALGVQEGKALGVQEGKTLGVQEGKSIGVQVGMLEATRNLLLDALVEKFGVMPARISSKIRAMENQDALEALFRQVFRCAELSEFEGILERAE